MRFMLTILGAVLLSASPVRADIQVTKERTAVIDGVIAKGNLQPIGAQLLKWSTESQEDITLIINSPGGEVITGFFFVNALEAVKERGVRVRCIVPNMAASMAFQILVHCSERHALNRSLLLWHRVRVFAMMAVITAPTARAVAADLQRMDDLIFRELVQAMPGDAAYIERHFEAETLHSGEQLHMDHPEFITTHSAIAGLYEVLSDEKIPRSVVPGMFDKIFRIGEIVYISPTFNMGE